MIGRASALKTYSQLGWFNVLAVFIYRLKLRSGFFSKTQPVVVRRWSDEESLLGGQALRHHASTTSDDVSYFNAKTISVSSPPSWLYDPYSDSSLGDNAQHWSRLPDFELNTGDIKVLWELSRFEWLIKACWEKRIQSAQSIIPVDVWLRSWVDCNPVNQGVNWKCAQEASIRLMHFIQASIIRHEGASVYSADFVHFTVDHVKRILPTTSYARAQNNNHGTSEAVALFVAGLVLLDAGADKDLSERSTKVGRRLLENRIDRLIMVDGVRSRSIL